MKKDNFTADHGFYTAEIRVTKECNLQCKHCSVSAGNPSGSELESDEIRALIDELSDIGVTYLVLTGGEPLLHKDITEIVEYGSSLGLRVSIDSNGSLLSEELAKDLKNKGLSTLQISVDGSEEVHDTIRGKGSFQKALIGIRNSLNAGLYTTVNFTISKENEKELERVIDLTTKLGVNGLTMERITPMGRGADYRRLLQSSEEFKGSLSTLLESKELKTNSTDPLALFLKKDIINKYSPQEIGERICGGCTAGIAALTISYDGEVYPCPKLDISLGNIRQDSLLDIWGGSNKILNSLRQRELKGKCGSCPWMNICGGCRAIAYALTGDFLEEDPACFNTKRIRI